MSIGLDTSHNVDFTTFVVVAPDTTVTELGYVATDHTVLQQLTIPASGKWLIIAEVMAYREGFDQPWTSTQRIQNNSTIVAEKSYGGILPGEWPNQTRHQFPGSMSKVIQASTGDVIKSTLRVIGHPAYLDGTCQSACSLVAIRIG